MFFGFNVKNFAQRPDSLKNLPKENVLNTPKTISVANSQDSVVKKDTLKSVKKEKFIPVPKKALLYSIIPGGGQIYNRKYAYIKVPIVYGALAVGIYAVDLNGTRYRYFKKNYFNKVNGIELDASLVPNIERVSQDVLKQRRDYYYKSLQQSYAAIAIGYILTAAEAFTAAHLMNFDINPDISMKIKPSFESLPIVNSNSLGLGLQLKF